MFSKHKSSPSALNEPSLPRGSLVWSCWNIGLPQRPLTVLEQELTGARGQRSPDRQKALTKPARLSRETSLLACR